MPTSDRGSVRALHPRPALVPGGLLWHVTVTVAGDPVVAERVRDALARLADEHPFLLAGRYANDRAEVRYWDEAPDAASAVSLALELWDVHRADAGLPPWRVVGVEVLDRDSFHDRSARGEGTHALVPAGGITPLESS